MQKFMVLYMAPVSVIEEWMKTPEEDRKAAEVKMQNEWREWMRAQGGSIEEQTAGTGKTKRVTKEGVTDSKNDIMLYSIVEAASHDAAAQMFKDHPHFGIPGAWIDIMPINPLQGM